MPPFKRRDSLYAIRLFTTTNYSLIRYLEAWRTLDDRALHPRVWQALVIELPATAPEHPLHVREVGADIGRMVKC